MGMRPRLAPQRAPNIREAGNVFLASNGEKENNMLTTLSFGDEAPYCLDDKSEDEDEL